MNYRRTEETVLAWSHLWYYLPDEEPPQRMSTVYYITKRTVHWSSCWKWPLSTTKHASHLVNTLLRTVCNDCLHITDTTRLKTSLKSSSVSARIDFIRPIPENSATHNSHMASDLVNKQPPPQKKKRRRLNGRLHRSAQKHVNFSKHSIT